MTFAALVSARIALSVTLWMVGLLLMWGLVFRRRTEIENEGDRPAVQVSVVIPARNEAHQIERLLRSLAMQSPAPLEVIVVDDDSSDGTGAIARGEGARVVTGEPLPEGWNGKSWACWQGAMAASGELLLFLDADTWLIAPTSLAGLVSLYPGRGLLAVQPYHVTHKAYEQFSAFFNIVLMAAMGAFTLFGDRLKPGGAFGPCVLCQRDDYFAVGGHRQVGGELLEDIPLGRLFLRHGLPLICRAGKEIIHFRMYPGGWRELVEGWTKGMGYGAVSVGPGTSLAAAAWIIGCFGAVTGLVAPLALTGSPSWPGVILYVAYALWVGVVLRQIGRFRWWTAAFYPLALTFFAVIVVRSFILTYSRRRIEWKGRAMGPNRVK